MFTCCRPQAKAQVAPEDNFGIDPDELQSANDLQSDPVPDSSLWRAPGSKMKVAVALGAKSREREQKTGHQA